MATAFIITGTTYTIPGPLTLVDAIGGGGAGVPSTTTPQEGGAGGGAAYASNNNTTFLTISGTVNVNVGLGGTASTASGTASWFNATSYSNAVTNGVTISLAAVGGAGATSGGVAGPGGSATNCVGTSNFSGGTAGLWTNDVGGVPGGGGAGGPNGTGGNGGGTTASSKAGGGGGGGGGGTTGGTAGASASGNGGNNSLGSGGGLGGTGASSGAPGTNGGGGGGGGPTGSVTNVGGDGGAGTDWDASHGSGGGAGGAGGATATTGSCGGGGLYGGGGSSSSGTSSTKFGFGAQGAIRVQYNASLGSQGPSLGRTPPIIFRPYNRPTGGLNPFQAYPVPATPAQVAVALFSQGVVQTTLRLPIAPTSGLSGITRGPVVKAKPSLTSALGLFGLAKVAMTKSLSIGSITVALLGRIAAKVQAHLAQAAAPLGLFGHVVSTTNLRLLFSGSTSLLGRMTVEVQSRLAQQTGSVSLLTRVTAAIQSRLSQQTGSVALFTRATAAVQARLAQATGVTRLLARAAAQIKAPNTLTATAQNTAALLGRLTTMVMARATPRGATGLFSHATSQVKLTPTLTAQSSLLAALMGLGKIGVSFGIGSPFNGGFGPGFGPIPVQPTFTAFLFGRGLAAAFMAGPSGRGVPTLDGTPANVIASSGGTSITIGPLSTTYANGYAIVAGLTTGANISSISGGGLAFKSRSTYSPGPTQYIEEWVAPISVPLSNVTLTVNFVSNCSYISYCFFAVSNGGNGVAFDVGGPQTAATGAASMTTSETAFVMCFARFTSPANAPTASSPWTQIYGGVANSFFCVESQFAAAGNYTGAFSATTENGSIIDALFATSFVPQQLTVLAPLLSHIVSQVKSLNRIMVQTPLTSALTGLGKIATAAHGTLSGAGFLLGRTTAQFRARMTPPGAQALIATATAMLMARFQAPSGKTSLAGRMTVTTAVKSPLTATQGLLARTAAAVRATANATTNTTLVALAAAKSQARAALTVSLTLLARTAAMVKSVSTLTAQTPLTTALTGLGKIVVTASAASATLATSLLARATAQVKARLTQPGAQALVASAAAMLMARLRSPTATAPLAGRMTLTTTVAPRITIARSLLGLTAVAVRAVSTSTRTAFVTALATVTTTVRAQATSKTALLGRSAIAATAQTVLVAGIALLGRAKGPAIQARLSQASRTIFFSAIASVAVRARFTPPTGVLSLFGRATSAVKLRGFTFTVGNLQALTGLTGVQTTARAASLSFRSNVIKVRTLVSAALSFFTTLTAAEPVKTAIIAETSLTATTVAYTATTTVTAYSAMTTAGP